MNLYQFVQWQLLQSITMENIQAINLGLDSMDKSDGFNTVSYNEKMFMILTLHRIIYGNII